MSENVLAMRDAFFNSLYEIAKEDRRVVILTADCGAPALDMFRRVLKAQYMTVGIAEQNMVSIAAGLALEGKIVYIYAIAPFVTLRCYEQIKVDLCCMNLNVTALGIGAGFAYDIMGPTHHTTEDISIMRALPNMSIFNPSDSIMAGRLARLTYTAGGPKYVRFDRGGLPLIYKNRAIDLEDGLTELKDGSDVCIIATGNMVDRAVQLSKWLSENSIKAGVVDLFRIKPLNEKKLLRIIAGTLRVATLEEHFMTGGIGSAVAELMADSGASRPMLRLGVCDRYFFEYGGRDRLHCLNGLDTDNIKKRLLSWMEGRRRPADLSPAPGGGIIPYEGQDRKDKSPFRGHKYSRAGQKAH